MKKERRVQKAFIAAIMLTIVTGGTLGWLMFDGEQPIAASQIAHDGSGPDWLPDVEFLVAGAVESCEGQGKVELCHVPPGNEGNPQTLCLPKETAYKQHLDIHEDDYTGACKSPTPTLEASETSPPTPEASETPTPTPEPSVSPTEPPTSEPSVSPIEPPTPTPLPPQPEDTPSPNPTSTPTPETRQVDVIAPEDEESELGETVYYSFNIVNLGNVADRFQLELISEHEFPTGDIPHEISLEAGESTTISTFVSLSYPDDDFPEFSELPSSDELTLNATSLTDASVQDADTVVTELAPPASQVIFTKTADKAVLIPGEQVVYTLAYRNTGNVPLLNVTLVDRLPDQLRFEGSSIPAQSADNGLLRFGLQPVLMQGESGTFTIRARVKPDADLRGVVVNRAELSADGLPDPVEAQSRSSIEVPDLTISKNSNRSSAGVGDILLFTIAIANNGNGTARSVRIIDNLPTVLSYIEGSSVLNGNALDDPQRRAGKELLWEIGVLKAGDEMTLRYQTTVTSGAKSGRYKNAARLEARDSGGRDLSAGPAKSSFTVKRRGLKGLADIEGLVFWDKNENGRFDTGEIGLPDLEIVMVREGRRLPSDEDGEFFFAEVKSEEQTVSLDELSLPQGFRLTTDSTQLLHLGERDLGYVEFGVQTGWAELIGLVFHDLNGNGRHDDGEPGVEGVSLTIDEEQQIESDGEGKVQFSALPAGMHSLMIDESTIPAQFLLKGDVFFLHQLKVQSSSTIYFPLVLHPGSITGSVFDDENENGRQDESERGVPGIEIVLQNGKALRTSTDADGRYAFTPLEPAAYTLRIAPDALPYNYQSANSLTTSLVLEAGQDAERSWGLAQISEKIHTPPTPTSTVSPTATETPSPTPTFTPEPIPEEEDFCAYTVKSGDTLSKITAQFTGNSSNYLKIADFNGIDADAIRVDGDIKLPKTLLLEEYQTCEFKKPEWTRFVGRVFFDKNRNAHYDKGEPLLEKFHAVFARKLKTRGKDGIFVFSHIDPGEQAVEILYGGEIHNTMVILQPGHNERDFPLKYSGIKLTVRQHD
ncbi:MAG: DUF11 domain-containing protein [bacterium]|nr:DUF11 domain-containing protein [bacterium]